MKTTALLMLAIVLMSGCASAPETTSLDVSAKVSMGVDDSVAGMPLVNYNLAFKLQNTGGKTVEFDEIIITFVNRHGETFAITETFPDGKFLQRDEVYEFETNTGTRTYNLAQWGEKVNLIVSFQRNGEKILGAYFVQLPNLESLPKSGIELRLKEMHGKTSFDKDGNPILSD